MRKKLLCLCTAVLLDLCFLGIVCRLAVGMQWEDLAEVEQADQTDQTVSSPECFSGVPPFLSDVEDESTMDRTGCTRKSCWTACARGA